MAIAGITGIGLGLVWNLWSSSYVLFAAGCSIAELSICYWAVEIKQGSGAGHNFWLVFGTNATSVYVFSELLIPALDVVRGHFGAGKLSLQRYIFLRMFAPIHDFAFASLLYSICFIMVCFLPAAILYHKKKFIKV